jgi:DNA-binding transcriptional ArsR family regulator
MSSEEWPGVRRVSDARTLRALAHPVRIALFEELGLYGPLTATEVGERIGETPTTCSFHLRQLAKYGFVEEAGGGKGRARPWRLTSVGLSFGSNAGDPEADVAADVLSRVVSERSFARYSRWMDTKASYPREWRAAADSSQSMTYLTPPELEQLSRQLYEVLLPWKERLTDPSKRPPGSVPVETLLFSYPVAPPESVPDPEPEPESGDPGGDA